MFYGGADGGSITGQQPDDFYYSNIIPVGDITGDEYADALVLERSSSQSYTIYTGSSSGLQSTGTTFSQVYGSSTEVIGFSDFNGDDIGDVMLGNPSQGTFQIIFGASNLTDIVLQDYTINTPYEYNAFNSAGFDTDGKDRVIRLANEIGATQG